MKKVLASLFAICLFSQFSFSQTKNIRPQSIGVSFIMNDFNTASRIRNGSVEQVIREKSWAKFKEMSPGLAVTYFKGLHPNIDFAGTLGASFVNYPIPNKPASSGENLLLEADASLNLKMFTDDYWVSPYLIAGIGASKYKGYYGAIIPLGGGLKVNFFDEFSLFATAQYRVGVTKETTNYHFLYSFGVAGILNAAK